jgi:hypothetical protein
MFGIRNWTPREQFETNDLAGNKWLVTADNVTEQFDSWLYAPQMIDGHAGVEELHRWSTPRSMSRWLRSPRRSST